MKEKTYILTRENGTRSRITVPADWKVTFGPAAKGNYNSPKAHLKMPLALRFYESDTKQRAIFTDVVSFRDASIIIEDEISKTKEKSGYMECDGKRKRTTFHATVKEWVNPDEVEKPTALPEVPSDENMFDLEESPV